MNIKHLKVNEVFTITLQGNPSTGYLWKFANIDGITLTNQTHKTINGNLVGGPTEITFFFRTDKPGEYNIRLLKVRPWEKNTPPIQTYEETVMVSQ